MSEELKKAIENLLYCEWIYIEECHHELKQIWEDENK